MRMSWALFLLLLVLFFLALLVSCILAFSLARILPVLFLAFFGSILSFSSTCFLRTFLRNIENFWGR